MQKWICLILLSMIWGSSYILIKIGLKGFGYAEAATIRLLTAGIVVMPWGLFYLKKIPLRKIPMVVLSSLLSMFMPAFLFCISQQHIQSSVAGILVAMTPSFTFAFSVFFFRSTHSKVQVLGLLLGLLCSIVLSLVAASGQTFSLNIYVVPVAIATMCYGLNINLVKHRLADVPSLQLSTVSVFINGLLALLLVLIPSDLTFNFSDTQWQPLGALLVLGIFATALAQLLHNKLISISTTLFSSTITYLIPVVAVMWGIADDEPLTYIHFIAIAGILLSIYMVRRQKKLSSIRQPLHNQPPGATGSLVH